MSDIEDLRRKKDLYTKKLGAQGGAAPLSSRRGIEKEYSSFHHNLVKAEWAEGNLGVMGLKKKYRLA